MRSMAMASMPSPWSITSMCIERHVDGLAVGDVATHQTPRWCAASMPAVISAGVISVCSLGATVP